MSAAGLSWVTGSPWNASEQLEESLGQTFGCLFANGTHPTHLLVATLPPAFPPMPPLGSK